MSTASSPCSVRRLGRFPDLIALEQAESSVGASIDRQYSLLGRQLARANGSVKQNTAPRWRFSAQMVPP
jgi:hypothetical protein